MKNTVKINEDRLRKIVSESVKKVLKESSYEDMYMEDILAATRAYDAWYQKLYEVKQKSWDEHDGRNTPELEHCFWAMRILSHMNDLLNSFYLLLDRQKKNNGNQPAQ